MFQVTLAVSIATAKGAVDAAEVAHWVGEALSATDVQDSHKTYHVHEISVMEDN